MGDRARSSATVLGFRSKSELRRCPLDETSDDREPPKAAARPSKRSASFKELGLAFVASLVITSGLSALQGALPSYASGIYVLVALSFVLLPTWTVRWWRRDDPIAAGMDYGRLRPGLAWGLAATGLTLVPFLLGFHIWTAEVQGRKLNFQWSNTMRWEPGVEGRGEVSRDLRLVVMAWADGRSVRIWWVDGQALAGDEPLTIQVTTQSGPLELDEVNPHTQAEVIDEQTIRLTDKHSKNVAGADLRIGEWVDQVDFALQRAGKALETSAIFIGRDSTNPASNPFSFGRNWWWILNLLLTQLLFVGLPEEYFYRGYIQPTLRLLDTGTFGFGRFRVSRSIVVTSLLFALGHVAIDGNLIRGAVFFPSLVFGWLRERSGGLTASIVYHAACNSMVELTVIHYFF